jgi:hypothetical protein
MGQGVCVVVIPHEFDAGVLTDQVAHANPVVQPVLYVDTIIKGSREIQATVGLSADEGRDFDAPFGPMPTVPPQRSKQLMPIGDSFSFPSLFPTLIPEADCGSVCDSQKL